MAKGLCRNPLDIFLCRGADRPPSPRHTIGRERQISIMVIYFTLPSYIHPECQGKGPLARRDGKAGDTRSPHTRGEGSYKTGRRGIFPPHPPDPHEHG